MQDNTAYIGNEYCPKCGKPYMYVGDPIPENTAKWMLPYCTCHMQEVQIHKDIDNTFKPMGWICPRCGKSWSPFVLQCDCPHVTITIGNTTNPIKTKNNKKIKIK